MYGFADSGKRRQIIQQSKTYGSVLIKHLIFRLILSFCQNIDAIYNVFYYIIKLHITHHHYIKADEK